MKKSHIAGLLLALAFGAAWVCAQEGQRPPKHFSRVERDDDFGPPPPHFFRPPPPPPPVLMVALDVNRDGKLDSQEISNAIQVLRQLDKNGDGELTFEELRPPFPPRGWDFDDEDEGECDGNGPGHGPSPW